jgi:hypothetical protein
MNSSPDLMPRFCSSSGRIACCALLLFSASAMGQENRSSSSSSAAVAQDTLKVMNDSDWARTVTPTIQDVPCTYRNAAFPGLFAEEKATAIDAKVSASTGYRLAFCRSGSSICATARSGSARRGANDLTAAACCTPARTRGVQRRLDSPCLPDMDTATACVGAAVRP